MTYSDKTGSNAVAVLAFLMGAGAGIAAGLLFAPREGRETREQIRRKAHDTHTKLRESLQAEKDMVSDVVDSAKQAVNEGKEALAGLKDTAKSHIR